ncbi:putative tubulin polyglutamylase TTLL2 [Aulostomus maculatus]
MAASLVFRLHGGGPELVREVLLERGWEEYDRGRGQEEDWNLYWRGSAFRNSEYHNLLPWQRLNHHPKTVGITRKDCLARNLRRMRGTFGSSLYNFSPTAFILPNDYTRFLAEYNHLRLAGELPAYWICKPADLSRGRGIFIFDSVKDLVYDGSMVVQRYISNPLLISGYKFDLRIYACVKSFHPLTVYIHQEGLVRFATEKYDLSSLNNLYAHLTNTSINKLSPFYKTVKERVGKGCKWTMSEFRHFLQSQDTDELLLWQRINNIVTLTLLAIAPSVPSCPNCVELFGFDVLIDVQFKPWLLEVNTSPALTLDCRADVAVKKRLVSDLIDLMNYTSRDRLRERAYRSQRHQTFSFHPHQSLHTSIPVLKFKELRERRLQTPQARTLPLIKALRQPDDKNQRRSRHHVFVDGHLPPVDLNKIYSAQGGIINCNILTATDKMPNLILGPHSRVNRETRPALARHLTGNRSLHASGVTNHDATEAETEMELSAQMIPDNSQRGLGFQRSAASCHPPNIQSGRLKPKPRDRTREWSACHIPPLRVGDFIRTFPFNAATLEAARHGPDVKTVIQELRKLTGRLASSRRKKKVRSEEKFTNSDEDFDSLLWGPKEPPLMSQCLKSLSQL